MSEKLDVIHRTLRGGHGNFENTPEKNLGNDASINELVSATSQKIDQQKQQLKKQKDQAQLAFEKKKAAKELAVMKTKQQDQLNRIKESDLEEDVFGDKFGRAGYWLKQHANRFQMYVKQGDMKKAEFHRQKMAEYKRAAYGALNNPAKQLKIT